MMKKLTVLLIVFGLVMVSTFSFAFSDEGPTVIIVGSERNKKDTPPEQEPENMDEYQDEENNQAEESPEDIGDDDNESPDKEYWGEGQDDSEESQE